VIWLGSSAFFTFGIVLVLLGATQAEVARALSLDLAASGFLGAVLALGIGAGVLIAGPLVDRFARAPLLAGSCLLCALGLFAIGPERSYVEIVAALVVLGIGCGVYDTLVNAVVLERAGTRGASALAIVHASATLGAAVGPLLVRFGLNHWNWALVYNAVGAMHVGLAVAAVSLRGSRPRGFEGRVARIGNGEREAGSDRDMGEMASDRGAREVDSDRGARDGHLPRVGLQEHWDRGGPQETSRSAARDANSQSLTAAAPALAAIAIATCAYVGLENGVTLFAVPWAASVGDSEPMGQWSISALWGGLLIGRLWLVALGMRREASAVEVHVEAGSVEPRRDLGLQLLAACGIGGAIFVCAGALLAHGPLALVTMLAGIALGPVYPLAMTLTARRVPSAAGTALGLVASMGAFGGFAIPWLAGAVGDRLGVQAAVTLLGLHGFVVAAAAVALARRDAAKLRVGSVAAGASR
jgi:fucose permease